MDTCYRLEKVCFRYSDQWVLEDFSLEVRQGEILGIIGPNGSGKTSLLKLMAGLLRPQTGHITLGDQDLAQLTRRALARWMAVVPQENHVLFPFTVAEVVLMGRFVHQNGWGWESADDLRIARAVIRLMDLESVAQRTFQELSGGERQRTIIARALAQEAPILLLDEPTAYLDIKHQLEIYATLKRLNQDSGVTIVVVSHDLNLASQYCHRLLLLHEGRAFRTGSPTEVLTVEHLGIVYGCQVIIDQHPQAGTPRITLPAFVSGAAVVNRDTRTTIF
ncbi:MAG TPA: heme ABC transporter ATP-binding protein [Nitrospirales bacterium]|jgi:iron complex transport system ATP-binding protein